MRQRGKWQNNKCGGKPEAEDRDANLGRREIGLDNEAGQRKPLIGVGEARNLLACDSKIATRARLGCGQGRDRVESEREE